MTLDDRFNTISTIIESCYQGINSQGTGFFYQETSNPDPSQTGPHWEIVKGLYLITNRHILLIKDENGNEQIPDTFTFYLRQLTGNKIEWFPVKLDSNDLKQRAKVHVDKRIDIAAISILDLVTKFISDPNNRLANWTAVNENELPSKNKIHIEVSDEAIVLGYPKGFYDRMNLFPIVKSGIIASRWGANFSGNPYFLIDSKLFPGSSGSLVISRPINHVIENGKQFYSKEKKFAFLGVYSGEPYFESNPIEFDDFTITRKEGFNVGIVWYSYLVVDIVKNGISI